MKLKEPNKIKVPEQIIFPITINVHNLAMSPDDLPEEYKHVMNEKGEIVWHRDGEWYIVSDYYEEEECLYSTPKLWYEVPEFDLKPTKEDLEKMSKEELIKMILKGQE